MTPIDTAPCPIGITINGIVAARVRALADEYGETLERGDAGRDRHRRLDGLLRSVLRCLRLESIDGTRYRVWRREGCLMLERLPETATPARKGEGHADRDP